ncbi:MAG: hypothetical protein JWN04_1155 [Myxococcaceae bacterium]|nr:hypothetical protein [Myxococcaceae bacterium]
MFIQLLAPLRLESTTALGWLSLLLSYSLQGCLWAAGAALCCRYVARRASTRHFLWKLSMLGPLLTTSVSVLSPFRAETMEALHVYTLPMRAGGALHPIASLPSPFVAAVVLSMIAIGLLRLFASVARLRHALAGRTKVVDPVLCARFERLCKRMGRPHTSLTQSSHAASPMVIGSREVCIPSTLLSAFEDGEIDAVFAHELAHLERGDGIWFPVIGVVQTVLWMQPLNHWLAARYRDSAELAADDRAIELTGAPLDLARALTRLAHTALATREDRMLPAMARHVSLRRVERLVCASALDHTSKASARARRWSVVALSAFSVSTPLLRVDLAAGVAPPAEGGVAQVAGSQPSESAHRVEMDSLALQAVELELSIAQYAGHESEPVPELLALQQALRHVHANEAWVERRFVESWSGAEARPARNAPSTPTP